jgi:hypothetical protein
MLCFVALARTDVSEELSALFIRVARMGELGTTLAVTSNHTTQRNTQEDSIVHSHRCENLTSYLYCFVSAYAVDLHHDCIFFIEILGNPELYYN